MYGEQKGQDVLITLNGEMRTLTGCNLVKLFNTMFNKPGTTYTDAEMNKWGLYGR